MSGVRRGRLRVERVVHGDGRRRRARSWLRRTRMHASRARRASSTAAAPGAAWLLLSQRVYTRDLLTGSKMFSGEVQSSFGTYATSSARSWLEPCAIAAVAAR